MFEVVVRAIFDRCCVAFDVCVVVVVMYFRSSSWLLCVVVFCVLGWLRVFMLIVVSCFCWFGLLLFVCWLLLVVVVYLILAVDCW